MQFLKQALPGLIYGVLCLLGAAMTIDWLVNADWVFCRLTPALCVSDFGYTGFMLQALYGGLGFLLMAIFAFMLYRFNKLGGARVRVNYDDRLIVSRSIQEIRQLCNEGRFGHALMLVETLRKKYPDNRQLTELEQRLNKALDHSES